MTDNRHTARLIRLPTVMELTGLSRNGIYSAVDRNNFPKPVKIGLRAIAWREEEVNAWIASRISAR